MARDNIRNFCIIAHIDHGKSTLSDRILELTKSVDERTMEDQILDNMDIERERGITIKARAVTMNYTAKDGKTYEFNLIDTPGHVDFAYEVSRSLAACEGAILVVDATQGVEAQTLANTYMALEHDLELVPILNKIDLPSAHPDEVAQEVEDVIGLPCMDAPRVSAKTGLNIDQVLERVVSDIPAPTGDPDAPLKALIFDSIYDSYKGVIVYIRVFEGSVKPGDTIRMMATGAEFTLVEVGHMGATSLTPCAQLQAGEVGYLTASIKTVQDTRVGDTVTLAERPTAEALPGYRQVKPMVFCGIYPADGAKYPDLKDALEKLQLNDASLTFELETSAALGFGFRCGFLGLLHMEIITERLEREFDLDLITTTPGVQYRLTLTDGMITAYDCANFEKEEDNRTYIEENLLYHHRTLPIGEFAIGTNTMAYVMAEQYGIAGKLPILIAEKMGPHFAMGDTCYAWAEDSPMYNPDGKEVIARENEVSAKRKEDPSKAYFGCHTDITIPYRELQSVAVEKADGTTIPLIEDGRFVLPGTEELNEPFG